MTRRNPKMNEIKKRSIVKYDGGYYRVTRATKATVNLGSISHRKQIYHKGIPKTEVVESEAEWYEWWSDSETYRSM